MTSDNEAQIERLLRFDVRDRADERETGRRPVSDEIDLDQRIEIDLFYSITDDVAVYLAAQAEWRNLVYSDFAQEEYRSTLSRKEAWIYAGNLFGSPVGLQIGAQRFSDDREWWWDRDLDAVRLRWDTDRLRISIGGAQRIFPRDLQRARVEAEEDDVLRFLVDSTWQYHDRHDVSFRFLHQQDKSDTYRTIGPCVESLPGGQQVGASLRVGCIDADHEDESDANLTWLGMTWTGSFQPWRGARLEYWVDAAVVAGEETFFDFSGPSVDVDEDTGEATANGRSVSSVSRHTVAGGAIDLGAELRLELPGRPTLVGGYAFGSGRPGDINERDRGYRQTGLHDNSDRYGGVATFKYYGELLDPELANLEIWTAGLGLRFLRNSSIDFVYHHYRQHELVTELRDVSIRRKMFAENRHLGDEFDLILGVEEWERLEIKSVFSVFWPGEAFGEGRGRQSYLASIRFRFNF